MNGNISSELLELNQLYQLCRNFALRFGLLPEQVKNLFGNVHMCFSATSTFSLLWVICFNLVSPSLWKTICGEYLVNSKREAFIKKGLENRKEPTS